jgi:hypothetical protein
MSSGDLRRIHDFPRHTIDFGVDAEDLFGRIRHSVSNWDGSTAVSTEFKARIPIPAIGAINDFALPNVRASFLPIFTFASFLFFPQVCIAAGSWWPAPGLSG